MILLILFCQFFLTLQINNIQIIHFHQNRHKSWCSSAYTANASTSSYSAAQQQQQQQLQPVPLARQAPIRPIARALLVAHSLTRASCRVRRVVRRFCHRRRNEHAQLATVRAIRRTRWRRALTLTTYSLISSTRSFTWTSQRPEHPIAKWQNSPAPTPAARATPTMLRQKPIRMTITWSTWSSSRVATTCQRRPRRRFYSLLPPARRSSTTTTINNNNNNNNNNRDSNKTVLASMTQLRRRHPKAPTMRQTNSSKISSFWNK